MELAFNTTPSGFRGHRYGLLRGVSLVYAADDLGAMLVEIGLAEVHGKCRLSFCGQRLDAGAGC
jgi:hypothetical protein